MGLLAPAIAAGAANRCRPEMTMRARDLGITRRSRNAGGIEYGLGHFSSGRFDFGANTQRKTVKQFQQLGAAC